RTGPGAPARGARARRSCARRCAVHRPPPPLPAGPARTASSLVSTPSPLGSAGLVKGHHVAVDQVHLASAAGDGVHFFEFAPFVGVDDAVLPLNGQPFLAALVVAPEEPLDVELDVEALLLLPAGEQLAVDLPLPADDPRQHGVL